ncbi:ABC transporter substrate-binding protein [Streptomyces sp. B93]|uniref:ABC transporter substrate-binding protein n=1 Tax=Streptomyces sp. B93 TaxID=2824875 RepID=UPI001B388200|nr:ABC transporter substrate-binding protein [Streptomyces sp. B93]MBQ1090705.1 ABC transporter substrate-binding protein [Streptomyces sp. B93]
MNNAKIGAAVLGGYVLGRTKKGKLAISLGALLAGSRVRPGQFGKALDSPFLHNITGQVRTELSEAGKAAASSVLTAKADHLADALHERTAGLRDQGRDAQEPGEGLEEEPPDEPAEGEAPEEETAQDETPKDKTAEDETPKRETPKKRSSPPRKKTVAASRSRRQGDG